MEVGRGENFKFRLDEEMCETSLRNTAIHIAIQLFVGGMLVYWKIWLNHESILTFFFSLLIEFCLSH